MGWWAGEGPGFLVYLQGTPRLAQQRSESNAARPVNPRVTHLLIGFAGACAAYILSNRLRPKTARLFI